jgi:hypothetical protein
MSGAARNRAYRERLKVGKAVYFVEADSVALAEALANAGFIAQTSEASHQDICAALQRAVEVWLAEESK